MLTLGMLVSGVTEEAGTRFMNAHFLWAAKNLNILESEECEVHLQRAGKYLAVGNFSSGTEIHNQCKSNTQNMLSL